MHSIISVSAKQTKNLAKKIAGEIVKARNNPIGISTSSKSYGVNTDAILRQSARFVNTSRCKRGSPGAVARRAYSQRKAAYIVGLTGNLGGGKTTFAQGFAKALGIKEKILSPTFVIIKKYKIQNTKYKIQNFYHIDCYRIENPRDIIELGWKEVINDPKNIVLIEWADKIKKIIPENSLWINFEHLGKNKRRITIL